jgi:hypothetical protein
MDANKEFGFAYFGNLSAIAGLSVGLIFNFRRAKLEWERIVLTDAKPRIDPASPTVSKQPQ